MDHDQFPGLLRYKETCVDSLYPPTKNKDDDNDYVYMKDRRNK